MGSGRRIYDLLLAAADFPRRGGPPERTIVICSQQRSGTTLLSEAMYFAGGLGCPLEYFHPGFRVGLQQRWEARDFRSYCAAVHEHRTDPSGVFSLKYFWLDLVGVARELEPVEFAELRPTSTQTSPATHRQLHAVLSQTMPNPFFVFLTRRDDVRQAVSFYIAGMTKRWRQFANRAGRYGAPPVYSFDQILANLGVVQNCNRQWLNFFHANGLQYYPMIYEDLAQDYEATLRKFFCAVGRPDAPVVPPRLQKQADGTSEAFFQRFMVDFRRQARVGFRHPSVVAP